MAKDRTGRGFALLTGIAYGAGMMYLVDPDMGRHRRALIRDKMVRAVHDARWWANKQVRNALFNLRGEVSELRANITEGRIEDRRLEERVRAQIGHVVSHPGPLEVAARDGHVTIRGPVLVGERKHIEDHLSQTRGVRDWTLDIREEREAGSTPGLQGVSRMQQRERVG
ncbi:MAG: hypothetical protein ACE14L_04320 [Terriglobales bacterium]